MISQAKARYIRLTPRKFRQIIPLVKGESAESAVAYLSSTNKRAALYAKDVIVAAIANARRLHQGIDTSTLFVSNIIADVGPSLKRFRAGSMGRASTIRKRTCHITVHLDAHQPKVEEAPKKKRAPRAKKAASK